MSDTVCRRDGCKNLLSDEDDEQGYEHCSPECCEACDDLGFVEYERKQQKHLESPEEPE